MADFLDIIPKELALLFLSGYILFLVKNWDSFSLLKKKDEHFEFNYLFRESAFYGIILYIFFATLLFIGQLRTPQQEFFQNITLSSSLFSLAFAFALLFVKAVYPRLTESIKRKKTSRNIVFVIGFFVVISIYYILYQDILGTLNIGLALAGTYFISREILATIRWEEDTFTILTLIFLLIIVFTLLLVFAFSQAVSV